MLELRPVYDGRGEVVLFDIFIDMRWHGSRRTFEQCFAYAFGRNR